jgi:hypothetical protein
MLRTPASPCFTQFIYKAARVLDRNLDAFSLAPSATGSEDWPWTTGRDTLSLGYQRALCYARVRRQSIYGYKRLSFQGPASVVHTESNSVSCVTSLAAGRTHPNMMLVARLLESWAKVPAMQLRGQVAILNHRQRHK